MGFDNNNNQNDSLDLQFVRELNETKELDFDNMLQAEKDADEKKGKDFKEFTDNMNRKANERRAWTEDLCRKAAESMTDIAVADMEEEIEAAKAKAEEEVRARWAKDNPITRDADPERQKIDQALLGLLRDYNKANS